jgi:hypothetical protein
MDSVTTVVNTVRAGRNLLTAPWPNGARVAVLLSFDVDNETVALRFRRRECRRIVHGTVRLTAGVASCCRAARQDRIPATFFIPSVSLQLAPEMADLIKKSGRHEFGIHGWIHEMNTTLPDSAERALLTKALAEVTRMTGRSRPAIARRAGISARTHCRSFVTSASATRAHSWPTSDHTSAPEWQPTGMVELPVEWILDDAPLFDPRGERYSPPREWRRSGSTSSTRHTRRARCSC